MGNVLMSKTVNITEQRMTAESLLGILNKVPPSANISIVDLTITWSDNVPLANQQIRTGTTDQHWLHKNGRVKTAEYRMKQAMEVICPECQADPGIPCHFLNDALKFTKYPHNKRESLARSRQYELTLEN